jgi:hypothetical protein
MVRFERGVAITLAVSACGSLLIFYLTREKEGKVQLPTHVDESEHVLHGHDPFDITTPEDLIDGYPINADAFWALVRRVEMVALRWSSLIPCSSIDATKKDSYLAVTCRYISYRCYGLLRTTKPQR